MFSGIVSALGRVRAIAEGCIDVDSPGLGDELRRGDSVAVNGVCLTVAGLLPGGFTADVMPETIARTTLRGLRRGDDVNLEPALHLGDALGGHLLTGHVDAVATITALHEDGNARRITVAVPDHLTAFLAEKGSVAVDGISLTVVAVEDSRFTVSLIPHTLRSTIAGAWREGSAVNLEVDVIARYVERAVAVRTGVAQAARA
jgi:riboflavin synthase